jgi:hypothetical protein
MYAFIAFFFIVGNSIPFLTESVVIVAFYAQNCRSSELIRGRLSAHTGPSLNINGLSVYTHSGHYRGNDRLELSDKSASHISQQ